MQKTKESNCSHRATERGQANTPQGERTRGESRGVEVTPQLLQAAGTTFRAISGLENIVPPQSSTTLQQNHLV